MVSVLVLGSAKTKHKLLKGVNEKQKKGGCYYKKVYKIAP